MKVKQQVKNSRKKIVDINTIPIVNNKIINQYNQRILPKGYVGLTQPIPFEANMHLANINGGILGHNIIQQPINGYGVYNLQQPILQPIYHGIPTVHNLAPISPIYHSLPHIQPTTSKVPSNVPIQEANVANNSNMNSTMLAMINMMNMNKVKTK